MNETYLISELRLRLATAFGELKICGEIDRPIYREAQLALRLMKFLNERSKTVNPTWE